MHSEPRIKKMKLNYCMKIRVVVLIVSTTVICNPSIRVGANGTKYGGFCWRSASNGTCPNPPTVDNLNLTAYLGRWYGIGSTARFKLGRAGGRRCNQAVYTWDSGATYRLVNSAQTVLSDEAIAQVGAINDAARGICASLSQACADVAAHAHATPRLAHAAAAARIDLSQLSHDVSNIQQINGKISQADYSAASKYGGLEPSVAGLRAAVVSAASRLKRLDDFAVELTRSSGQKAAAAARIRAISAGLSSALLNVSDIASGMLSTGQPALNGTASYVAGTIAQPDPVASAGKLQVSLGPVPGPYWIIDLLNSGTLSHPSYSAALVYSCSQSAAPLLVSQSLFILSREISLDGAIISGFLDKARSLGIYNDCDDPFILTAQQGGDCGRVA